MGLFDFNSRQTNPYGPSREQLLMGSLHPIAFSGPEGLAKWTNNLTPQERQAWNNYTQQQILSDAFSIQKPLNLGLTLQGLFTLTGLDDVLGFTPLSLITSQVKGLMAGNGQQMANGQTQGQQQSGQQQPEVGIDTNKPVPDVVKAKYPGKTIVALTNGQFAFAIDNTQMQLVNADGSLGEKVSAN